MENISLADWAAWYDLSGKPYTKPCSKLDIDNYPLETNIGDANDDYDDDHQGETQEKNKKRLKARIIRSVFFNKEITVN